MGEVVDLSIGTNPLIALSKHPSAEWTALRDRSGCGVHGSDAWIAYRAAMGNAPRYLLLGPDGEPAGVGVAYEKRPRFRPWKRSRVFLDRAPWASMPELAAGLIGTARQRGWAELRVHSFDGPFGGCMLEGFQTSERYEFLLDLSEDRFAACTSSLRRNIRKAERDGVEVAEETGAAGVELLRGLQGHTRDRRQERGEELALPDAAQYRVMGRTLIARGGGRLFVARKGGEPVSSILVGVGGARAYDLMSGTSRAGLACNAACLVMWRAIELLQAEGFAVLNLGGVPARAEDEASKEHGLYQFKLRWGGERVTCFGGVWRP